MKEFLTEPWPWYIAGPMISLTMFLLLYFGKNFGVSSNFRTMCAACGFGKNISFFNFKWKDEIWNLLFLLGVIIGGLIASQFFSSSEAIAIAQTTKDDLSSLGISNPGATMLPEDIFSWTNLGSLSGLIIMVGGGFLIGFGTRYAGGCTSGHAISGLSDLQLPSLIAVIGFFIGGLTMTYFLLPLILKL